MVDKVMIVVERVVERLVREKVHIDGFVSETTNAIFIVRWLQVKYLKSNNKLDYASNGLEKAFNSVQREVVWWVMRKLSVEEWLVSVVQSL